MSFKRFLNLLTIFLYNLRVIDQGDEKSVLD